MEACEYASRAGGIVMSRNDSAESTGAFRPGLATHLADARTSESTGFSESWRGIVAPTGGPAAWSEKSFPVKP
jgi:hypothetical protein